MHVAWTNRISLKRLKHDDLATGSRSDNRLNKQNLAQEIETMSFCHLLSLYFTLEQTESRSRDWNKHDGYPLLPDEGAWTNRISLKRLKRAPQWPRRKRTLCLNKQNLAQEIETWKAALWWGSRTRAWTNRISLKRLKLVKSPISRIGQHRLNKQNLAQEIETALWPVQRTGPLLAWTNRISLKRLKQFNSTTGDIAMSKLEQTESRSRDWNPELMATKLMILLLEQTESRSRDWNWATLQQTG